MHMHNYSTLYIHTHKSVWARQLPQLSIKRERFNYEGNKHTVIHLQHSSYTDSYIVQTAPVLDNVLLVA